MESWIDVSSERGVFPSYRWIWGFLDGGWDWAEEDDHMIRERLLSERGKRLDCPRLTVEIRGERGFFCKNEDRDGGNEQ
jgi:hypothetical protein